MIAGTLEIQMMANIARLSQDMNQAKGAVGDAMESIKKSVETAKHALEALGVGFSLHEISEQISGVVEGLAKLKDASEKTGASVEGLSKLQFFAGASGSNIDGVTSALVKLSRGMAGADTESKGVGAALQFLGLSAKDAAGNLKDPSALFTEISQKLIQYEDGAGKAAIAQALFGKAGADMLPTLKKMAELGDAEATATTQQAEQAEAYGLQLAKLNAQKLVLERTVVGALIPTMTDFVNVLLAAGSQADSLGASAKGLAEDKSLENWADKAALAIAGIADIAKSAVVGIADLAKGVALLAAINDSASQARSEFMKNPTGYFDQLSDHWARVKTMWDAFTADVEKSAESAGFKFVDAMQSRIASRKQVNDFSAQMTGDDPALLDAMFGGGVDDKLKKLNFSVGQGKATPFDKALGSLGGEAEKLRAEIDALGKYADAAEHAKEAETLFQTEKGKYSRFSDDEKAQLLDEARLVDQLTVRKNLLTQSSKNYNEAAAKEIAAQLSLSMGTAGATEYADAISKLQRGQLASLTLDGQRTYVLNALNATIADGDLKMAGMTTVFRDQAAATLLDIQLLGENRYAAQYAAEAKAKFAASNVIASKSSKDSAIATAADTDALNKFKDLAQLTIQLQDRTKQLGADSILDDRQRALAQIKIETDKYQQLIQLTQKAYDAMLATGADADVAKLAALKKTLDDGKDALDQYTQSIQNKQAADEFKQLWSTVENTGHDAFTHLLADGTSTFRDIGKTIKTELIELLYQLTVKRWIINIGTSIAGSLGIASAANAAGSAATAGGAGGLNLMGGGNVLSALGSSPIGTAIFGSSAAYGALPGLSFGSQQAAMLAEQTGEFGVAGLDATMNAASNGASTLAGAAGSYLPYVGAALQLAMGNVKGAAFTAAGAAIGSVIPGIGTAIGAVVGSLIGSLVGGKNSIPSKGLGGFNATYDAAGNLVTGSASQYGGDSASAQKFLGGLRDQFDALEKSLGAVYQGVAFSYDTNSGKDSKSPNFMLSAGLDSGSGFVGTYSTGGETPLNQDAVDLAVSRAMVAGLKASTLPKYLQAFFDSIDPAQMSKQDLDNALATAQGLMAVRKSLEQLAAVSGTTPEALDELTAAMSKIANIGDLLTSYNDNFYSDTEKHERALSQVNDALASLGITGVTTRDQFRALVEAQDKNTEAGRTLFLQLIQLAPAFAAVTEATDAIKSELRQAYKTQADDLTQAVSKWADAAKTLRDYGASLFPSTSGGMSYSAAAARFAMVSAQARAGSAGAMSDLPSVSDAFKSASLANSRTSLDYARDIALIRGAVSDAADAAEGQSTIAQQQLDALTQQVSALVSIDDGVKSVADAIRDLNATIAAPANEAAYGQAKALSDSLRDQQAAFVQSQGGSILSPEDITQGIAQQVMYYLNGTEGTVTQMGSAYGDAFLRAYGLYKAIPGHAGGGMASGWSWVGERGPELVDFATPGRVYTAQQSGAMAGGGNTAALEARIGELSARLDQLISVAQKTEASSRKTATITEAVSRGDLSYATTAA
jgi:hypothetical protein